MPINPTQAPPPTLARRAAGFAGELALSIGAGVAADRLHKSLFKQGPIPAILGGIAGAAALKSVAKGTVQVADNALNDRDVLDRVDQAMLEGLRTGAIDGALAIAGRPIAGQVARWLPNAGIVKQAMATGAAMGTLGGTAHAASTPATWQDGVTAGVTQVAVAGGIGAATGLVIGGVTGAIVKRFRPAYQEGSANRHQIRQLARERGEAQLPRPAFWEEATAHAKEVSRMTVEPRVPLDKLGQTPEMQAFMGKLKPGDVILMGGRSSEALGKVSGSPYAHAAIVTEVGPEGVQVVESIEKGVRHTSLLKALKYYLPDGKSEAQAVLSVVRPTKDGQVAAQAVAFAREQVGKGYNYTFQRGDNPGKTCAQLVYEAYEANPAIPDKPLKILQMEDDIRKVKSVLGVGENGSVPRIMERVWTHQYEHAPLPERLTMAAKDAASLASGAIQHGVKQAARFLSADGGATLAPDYRYQPLQVVMPADLNLSDGRKLATLVLELATP